jgi:hypothetical protein
MNEELDRMKEEEMVTALKAISSSCIRLGGLEEKKKT